MARPLREAPPSSAVARMLDVSAAARALAVPPGTAAESPNDQPAASSSPLREKRGSGAPVLVKREFVLSPETDQALCGLVEMFRRTTGARLSGSHVLRALLLGVSHSHATLEMEARRVGALRLPSNARGYDAERVHFERRIAAVLVAGMRAAAALDPTT